MAKWGEGDPRWIVEERPDATNVNNWHWVEKDATNWSRNKLKALLEGLKFEDNGVCYEIKELSKIDGDAWANNRKGKVIIIYDLKIEGTWEGYRSSDGKKFKGKFDVPNLSEEIPAHELELNASTEKESKEAFAVKEVMRVKGRDVIREKLAIYIKELSEEYTKDLVKPSKGASPAPVAEQKHVENKFKAEMNKVVQSNATVGVRIHTKKLTMTEEFQCSANDLYLALTDKARVMAFMGGSATFDGDKGEVVKGERFTMMDGNIMGEYLELVLDKKIVQKWRVKSWPDEHYSQVTLELDQGTSSTKLLLTQTGVPESELEKTKERFWMHYWERIRQTFGYGARLY